MKHKRRNCEIIERTPAMEVLIKQCTLENKARDALKRAKETRQQHIILVASILVTILIVTWFNL